MKAVTEQSYLELLARAGLEVADSRLRIGKQLTYVVHVPRMIVLHLGERDTDTYIRDAVSRVLELGREWLLAPRYGSASDLGLLGDSTPAAAISFGPEERSQLAHYLRTRPMSFDSPARDLYVLSGDGNILVTWDHHTADEGLKIELRSIIDAGRLLVLLNELGAELELFYHDG